MLFNSNGTVAKAGDWIYSDENSAGISAVVSVDVISGSPVYYSHGYVQIWSSPNSKYLDYRPDKSPNLNNYT